MMAESIFDKLAGRVAVNKQSAQSAFGSGTHYTPKLSAGYTGFRSDVPPPMKPVPPDAPQLVGTKFGRFVVVGLLDGPKRSLGARWVVRCTCGTYETRVAKSIRNPENQVDRCQECRNLERLKLEANRVALGDERAFKMRDEARARGETI
jgi:hypothetical protein